MNFYSKPFCVSRYIKYRKWKKFSLASLAILFLRIGHRIIEFKSKTNERKTCIKRKRLLSWRWRAFLNARHFAKSRETVSISTKTPSEIKWRRKRRRKLTVFMCKSCNTKRAVSRLCSLLIDIMKGRYLIHLKRRLGRISFIQDI